MTAGLYTLGPVVSFAAARAARGLPPPRPDQTITAGDQVRIRDDRGTPLLATVIGREGDGRLVLAVGDRRLSLPRDQVERLARLHPGARVRQVTTGRLGTVERTDGAAVYVDFDGQPGRWFLPRLALDPCAGPWAGSDSFDQPDPHQPEPPEAA